MEIIYFEQIKDFDEEFKQNWRSSLKLEHKKGWKTWIRKNDIRVDSSLHFEDNKYNINFKPNDFKEIKPNKYYKIGDWIKLPSKRPKDWSSNGDMDKFLNWEVEITGIIDNHCIFENYEGWAFNLKWVTPINVKETASKFNTVKEYKSINLKKETPLNFLKVEKVKKTRRKYNFLIN